MLKKTEEYMKKHHMLKEGERVVLGLSGGADSVCLFHVLRELEIPMEAVHVHHGIRGEEADRDEAFVRTLCEQYQVPFHSYRFDVPEIARIQHLSVEAAGRMVRRRAFAEVQQQCGAAAVALAHHGCDRAETFLFHLIRGSGIRGLSSMRPVEEGRIRPLLWAEREQIEEFLKQKGYAYVTDSTNAQECYTRNKLRHRVIPELETINTGAVAHICSAAEKIEEVFAYLDREAERIFRAAMQEKTEALELSKTELFCADEVLRIPVLQKCVEYYNGGTADLAQNHYRQLLGLFDMQAGKELHLPCNLAAVRTYQGIRLQRRGEKERILPLEICGPGNYFFGGKRFEVTVEAGTEWKNFPPNHYTKCFDYDKISRNVFLRTRNTGDYLEINQNHGRKSLQDYLVNEKVPREDRDQVILLAEGSHILWVVGKRISEYYKVTGETKRILKVQMYGEEYEEV